MRWRARGHGQPLRRERRQDGLDRHEARGLDGRDRISDEGKHADRGSAQPAAEAMILVVDRTGVMVVVRVRARLVRRMGEDPPAGIVCGTRLARLSVSPEILVKLVKLAVAQ